MTLLLFDIDGTLVRVNGRGREAVNEALASLMEQPISVDGVTFSGRTDPAIVEAVLSHNGLSATDAVIEDVIATYVETMQNVLTPADVEVLPGVAELLAELHARPTCALGWSRETSSPSRTRSSPRTAWISIFPSGLSAATMQSATDCQNWPHNGPPTTRAMPFSPPSMPWSSATRPTTLSAPERPVRGPWRSAPAATDGPTCRSTTPTCCSIRSRSPPRSSDKPSREGAAEGPASLCGALSLHAPCIRQRNPRQGMSWSASCGLPPTNQRMGRAMPWAQARFSTTFSVVNTAFPKGRADDLTANLPGGGWHLLYPIRILPGVVNTRPPKRPPIDASCRLCLWGRDQLSGHFGRHRCRHAPRRGGMLCEQYPQTPEPFLVRSTTTCQRR
jgi:Predicted phosphatases